MTVIEGKEEILEAIEKKLDQIWKRLSLKYRKVKGKILFALLFTLNHRYLPSVEGEYPTEDPNWFRSVLKTLDAVLEKKWSVIDTHMTQKELSRFSRIVLREFSELGKLRQLKLECESFNIERLEYNEDQSLSDASLTLDAVFDEWLKLPFLDEIWFQYAYDSPSKAARVLQAINQELLKRYNIRLEVLYQFGTYINQDIRAKLEPQESKMFSLMGLFMEHFIQRFHSLDSKVDVRKLLPDIVYSPSSNWMLAPFVRLRDNSTQKMTYYPIVFAFYPHEVFSGAWMYHIPKEATKSSALGIMSDDWGKKFEKYVRNQLKKHHPHLNLNKGRTKIRKSDYPSILNCIGKPSIEIDSIAQSSSKVYLISCKALDQFSGPKMLQSLLGSTFEEFENKLRDDLENAGEIDKYAECIQGFREYAEAEGWGKREIIPVLITSDVRPLSLNSACQWLVDAKIANKVPNVRIIQAREISSVRFD